MNNSTCSLKLFLIGLMVGISLSGCVSNKAVPTVQSDDRSKSCSTLKTELDQLGATFEDSKDDSGITGKNVGLAIVFWPGIIVNEYRANKNQDSIDSRINHLSVIYTEKCANESMDLSLEKKLLELKSLREQGLIDEKEHEASRKRLIENF